MSREAEDTENFIMFNLNSPKRRSSGNNDRQSLGGDRNTKFFQPASVNFLSLTMGSIVNKYAAPWASTLPERRKDPTPHIFIQNGVTNGPV